MHLNRIEIVIALCLCALICSFAVLLFSRLKSASAPPASVTKAAYDVFRSSAQSILKKIELEDKYSSAQLRLIRHMLNDFTQSVFLQVRANLLVPGVEEAVDPNLATQAAAAELAYKQARVALQQTITGVEALIEQEMKAPLAEVDLNLNAPIETPTPNLHIPSGDDLQRFSVTDDSIRSTLDQLSSKLPQLLETAKTQVDHLASSTSSTQPISQEVRHILAKMNEELDTKKTRSSARQKATKDEGEAGKVTKSPKTRSARLSAKPY